jgi:hypothetical protein
VKPVSLNGTDNRQAEGCGIVTLCKMRTERQTCNKLLLEADSGNTVPWTSALRSITVQINEIPRRIHRFFNSRKIQNALSVFIFASNTKTTIQVAERSRA